MFAPGAGLGTGGRRRRLARRRRGLRDLAGHHAGRAQPALLKFADAIEARAEEIIEAEARNTGKPIALTRDEVPAAGRPDPLLRRRRAAARRAAAGEYMAGSHLVDPPRAGRRLRPGHALELPDDDGGLEVRAGARRRQHRGAQAVGHHAGDHAAAGRDRRRVPPAGRVQRRLRRPRHRPGAGRRTRPRRWSRSPARSGPAWRSPGRRRRPQAGAPRTRRQGAGHRLRRRRRRAAVAGHRRAGYFNAGQDCTAATRVLAGPGITTTWPTALAEQAAAR